jgi:thiosulfate/3-mercaptopyruvate sulfurtransferase
VYNTAALRALAYLCLAAPLAAQRASSRESLLVPASWLAAHVNDQNLVVLHVGDRAEYDKGHLPGARFVPFDAISVSDRTGAGLTLEMLPADKLRESLASFGISNDSRIVVTYDSTRVTQGTRLVFTLDYAGLGDRTSLLDGGVVGWKRDGRALTTEIPAAKTGTLAALTLKPIVVTADYVQSRVKRAGTSVVDGRAIAFYDGTQTGGGRGAPHKTGHVAGAKSVPFTELTDVQSFLFKPADQLGALFAAAGVAPADTIVGYCHIGQQATAMLFAARTLGHPVLLYDGSFEDWSRRDLPVETSKKP